ncbi:MAG: hypothetical protein QNJ02_13790 [Desulfobacterales bacterium]|nr:hypothetical protein [Desulfobacterales bacterium]
MIRPPFGRFGLILAAIATVLLVGCTAFKQRVTPPPPPDEAARPAAAPQTQKSKNLPVANFRNRQYYVHQVRWPKESLALIAQWYTGSRSNWKKLARATPNLRENRLYQGFVVFIPLDLLQIETPMPKQYVQQQASPAVSAPAKRPPQDPKPQPYGPRPYPKKATP